MTIDRGPETERYQGVVPLEGESLTEAADTYFRQSEQLPTFIKLAVARHYRAGQGGRPWTWRAGGLLVQKLTREGGRAARAKSGLRAEDWTRAKALAETVEDHELLDPMLPPDRLLYRLFHEEQVRAFRAVPLRRYCSCSRGAGRGTAQALLGRGSCRDGGGRRSVGHLRVLQQPLSASIPPPSPTLELSGAESRGETVEKGEAGFELRDRDIFVGGMGLGDIAGAADHRRARPPASNSPASVV